MMARTYIGLGKSIEENINTSAKYSPVLCEVKQHKP